MAKTNKTGEFTSISVKISTLENIKALNLSDIQLKNKVVPIYQSIDDVVAEELKIRLAKKI